MGETANQVLRDIIDRHGRILLDHPQRCEGCLRDSALATKEFAGIMAALKAGIPKRLAALPDAALSEKGLANFAVELSESSGLSDQVALSSVTAWAYALGPRNTPTKEEKKKDEKKGEERKKEESADPKASEPSLSEAVVAAIFAPLICYGAYVVGTFKIFGFEVPAFIFALIVVVKAVQSIGSYLTFRFGKTTQ